MDAHEILSKRAVGSLPLSIGTSLAIEALKPDHKYGSLWINLRTLFRNIYESVDKDFKRYLTAEAVVDVMEEELTFLLEHCRDKIDHIQVYHREYADLLHRFPRAIIKVPKTPLQLYYDRFMNAVIDEVLFRDKEKTIDFDMGSVLKGNPVKSLIITHYPLDLLSRSAFTQLRLLESYTGMIKSKSQWNSKLTDSKLIKQIPFNEFTIQIFGDGPVQFMRFPKAARDEVIQLSLKYKWTSMTTMERIKLNLNSINDRFLAETLKGLL